MYVRDPGVGGGSGEAVDLTRIMFDTSLVARPIVVVISVQAGRLHATNRRRGRCGPAQKGEARIGSSRDYYRRVPGAQTAGTTGAIAWTRAPLR